MRKQILCGILAAMSFSLSANSTWAQNDLPSGEEVISTYVKKTGGIEKYKSIKNAKIKGEMSIPAANIQGKVEIVFVAPNKFHFNADLGGLGSQQRGSDGKVVWETSTLQGARIIKGDEAAQMLQEISMASILTPKKFYKSIKTVGKEKVKGDECYVVELTRKNGNVDKEFYSIKSGLRVKTIKKVESPLGQIDVEGFDSNYKKSKNGLLSAWTGEQKMGPNSILVKMSSVEFNLDVDKSKFELPAEVKELVGK